MLRAPDTSSVYCLCCQADPSVPNRPITPVCEQHGDIRIAWFGRSHLLPMNGSLVSCPIFNSDVVNPDFPSDSSVPLQILEQIPEEFRLHLLHLFARDEGVQAGLRSEQHVLSLLRDHSQLSKLVIDVEHSPPLSPADHKGFDLVVYLDPNIANVLGLSNIKIQVKTLPDHFVHYVKMKLIEKIIDGKLNGKTHLPIIEEGLILVSAGAGETADVTIMSAIIHQLLFYCHITGGDEKVQTLIDALNQIDPQIFRVYEGQVPLVLTRDYDPLLEYLGLLENIWRSDGVEGLRTYYETEVKPKLKKTGTKRRPFQPLHQSKAGGSIHEAPSENVHDSPPRSRPKTQSGSRSDRPPRKRRSFVRPGPAQTAF